MKVSEVFPGKYMKAADLQGQEYSVTIDNCVMERVVENEPEKVILYFSNSERGMVCNKTNALELASVYGDDMDLWRGKPAMLYTAKVQFNGKMVDGLRLRVDPTQNQPQVHPNPDPPLQSSSPDNDDLPF